MTFTANGEYIIGGGSDGAAVWRVKDGKQMATMEDDVRSLAVSKDGRGIAAWTNNGYTLTWDANFKCAVDYRGVAADSMITAQFQDNVSLADLLDNVRTIDVL